VIDFSPAEGLSSGYRETSRDRVLTDQELATIIVGARQMPHPYSGIVELLALTGQRREEVAQLKRDELDEKARTWTIPGARTKKNDKRNGRRNGKRARADRSGASEGTSSSPSLRHSSDVLGKEGSEGRASQEGLQGLGLHRSGDNHTGTDLSRRTSSRANRASEGGNQDFTIVCAVELVSTRWPTLRRATTSATPLFHDWPDAKVTSRVPRPRALKTPPVNSHVQSWSSHSP
jgi:hypothetical protein